MLKHFLIFIFLMTLSLSAAELKLDSFAVSFDRKVLPASAETASLDKSRVLPGTVQKFTMPADLIYDLRTLKPDAVALEDMALVSFVISAEKAETILLGVYADFLHSLYLDGKQIGTTEPDGEPIWGNTITFNQRYKIDLKQGENYFVMHTRAGGGSWNIALRILSAPPKYGPYVLQVDRDSAAVAMERTFTESLYLRYWEDGGEAEKKDCKTLKYGRIERKKIHRFELENLKPDTVYHFEILPAGNREQPLAPSGSFKTLPAAGTKHVMTAISDTQHPVEKRMELIRNFVKKGAFKDTDLLVSLGDVDNYMDNFGFSYFEVFLNVFRSEGVTAPFYPVRGNHEYRGLQTDHYHNWFGCPYYAFRVGDVLYIVLDTGEDKGFRKDILTTWRTDTDTYFDDQKAWLENLVKSDLFQQAKVRIVLAHSSPFERFNGKYFAGKIDHIAGCLMGENPAGTIDLWISGHTHSPFRYDPVSGDLSGAERGRLPVHLNQRDLSRTPFPVYVNDGPGGTGTDCSITRVEVDDAGKLHVKCIGEDGSVMDSIVIERGKPFTVKESTFIKYNFEPKKGK